MLTNPFEFIDVKKFITPNLMAADAAAALRYLGRKHSGLGVPNIDDIYQLPFRHSKEMVSKIAENIKDLLENTTLAKQLKLLEEVHELKKELNESLFELSALKDNTELLEEKLQAYEEKQKDLNKKEALHHLVCRVNEQGRRKIFGFGVEKGGTRFRLHAMNKKPPTLLHAISS